MKRLRNIFLSRLFPLFAFLITTIGTIIIIYSLASIDEYNGGITVNILLIVLHILPIAGVISSIMHLIITRTNIVSTIVLMLFNVIWITIDAIVIIAYFISSPMNL
ncbi:hypothetical protein [Vallitalea guaymasensis]|uniref:hypothetical protein n=1 Tax=Vallitalea guaymasensis TaxID=1185412 RepID=UPI001290239B|nr:hypothetical protein [Vallitalea guaymasensis]